LYSSIFVVFTFSKIFFVVVTCIFHNFNMTCYIILFTFCWCVPRARTIIGKGALSASRRLIESFSLSHTKDVPCTFIGCYRCADIYVLYVYMRNDLSAASAALLFPASNTLFSTLHCILLLSFRFSAFLRSISSFLNTNSFRCSNKFIMILPKSP